MLCGEIMPLDDYDEIQEYATEAFEIGKRLDVVTIKARALTFLALVAVSKGDAAKASQQLIEAAENAITSGDGFVNQTVLYGYTQLLIAQSKHSVDNGIAVKAVERLTLLSHHRASPAHWRKAATAFLQELAANLPSDLVTEAKERGQQMSLESAVAGIMTELEGEA